MISSCVHSRHVHTANRCELIWTALSASSPTTKPRYDDERFMSQSNDRPLPARCQGCGTVLPADSICCVQCGQIHNEQGLAELKERCEVLNRATGLREGCAVPTRHRGLTLFLLERAAVEKSWSDSACRSPLSSRLGRGARTMTSTLRTTMSIPSLPTSDRHRPLRPRILILGRK
jgi:hypothetical protein